MIIIDFSQVVISSIMADLQGRTDVQLNVPLVRHMIINAIRGYKVKFGKDYGELVIACDSRNYWRKKVFPNYKAGRKKTRASSGYDWDSIYEALNQVKQELEEFFPYPVVEVDGAEADDVLASLVFWSQTHDLVSGGLTNPYPRPILLLSGDHDFVQLQKFQNVKQYNPIQKKFLNAMEDPQKILVEHILRGDKGDGVPTFLNADDDLIDGVRAKAISEVNLARWKELTTEEIAVDGELLKKYPKTFLERTLKRNRELVDLDAIPQEIQDEIVQNYLSQRGVRDRSRLMEYFAKNGMNKMIESITDF